MRLRRPSFIPLYLTNLFGTVNDNFLKTLATLSIIKWLKDDHSRLASAESLYMGATAAALVLPYILFSPLADRMAMRLKKAKIVRLAKWAELPIMAVAIAGFMLHSAWIVIGSVLLMGLQSSLYSPAKYALVRDIGGMLRISTGMGGMEGISFFGMLTGTIAAAISMETLSETSQQACLVAFAVLGLVASFFLWAPEKMGTERQTVNPWRFFRDSSKLVSEYPGLSSVIFCLGVFWWGAAMLQMGLMIYGKKDLALSDTHTGFLLCSAAVGMVAGQVVSGVIDKRRSILPWVPVAGLLGGGCLLFLAFRRTGPAWFAALTGLLTAVMGFFKQPLDAEIQKVVRGPRLNTVLAYFNQVTFLFMFLASGMYALLSWLFGTKAFLAATGAAFVAVSLHFALAYRPVFLRIGRGILARRYRLGVEGGGALETDGPLLVLPNHPAMVDPMLLVTHFWRIPLRPLVDERFFRGGPLARRVLRTLRAVKVPDLRKQRGDSLADRAAAAHGAADALSSTLAAGGAVLCYPAGHIQTSPDVEEIGNRQMVYNACRTLPPGTRVVGIRTRGLWGSRWSRAGRDDSPPFVATLLECVPLWLAAPFFPRRNVSVRAEDLTEQVTQWATGTRQEFNHSLEAWFNGEAP